MTAPGDSLVPLQRGAAVTWPMVALAFVKELPYTLMVVGGTVLGVTFVFHSPSSAFEPLAAVIGPAIVSALGRSQPSDRVGGLGALVAKLAVAAAIALACVSEACTPADRTTEAKAAARALDVACALRDAGTD